MIKILNKKAGLIFLICCHICILVFACDVGTILYSHRSHDSGYPATLFPLPPDTLAQLQTQFEILNDHKICTGLNKYGWTGHDCCRRSNPGIRIAGETDAMWCAVHTLIKNSRFTNVKDSIALMSAVPRVTCISDDSTHWGIRFGAQRYHGMEVRNTGITVSLYGDGVFNIDGFWYDDFYIPPEEAVDRDMAACMVTGKEIEWSGIGGEPHLFTVTGKSVGNDIQKVISPLLLEDAIELRIAWKIPILFDSFTGWHIYMDVMTGEILETVQEFRT